MNPGFLQRQLASNFIREGHLFKRSKFLKAWEDRWLVLTVNFLFIFQNRSRKDLIDSIDLNEVRNYKSYVRKDEDVLTNCIKIRTEHHMYYLGFGSVLEKWTWLVTLERLMDVKLIGRTHYNCQEWIATRGFPSQLEFQNKEKEKGEQVGKGEKAVEKALERNDAEVQRLRRLLDEQQRSFEAALKQKYKELNVIEEHMRQKEKEYFQLSEKLKVTLEEANQKVKLAEAQALQAENKAKNAQIATNINIIETAIASFVEQEGDAKQKIETLALVTLENEKLKAEVSSLTLKLQQQKEILSLEVARSQQAIKQKEEALEKEKGDAAIQNVSVLLPQKKELPLTNHTIRSFYQFEMVQSMLGYSLSHAAKPQLALRAVIIPEQAPASVIKAPPIKKPAQQSRTRPVHFVQTVLGFSVPLAHEQTLHTDGSVSPAQPTEAVPENEKIQQAAKEIPESKAEEVVTILTEQVEVGVNELAHEIQLLSQKIIGLEQQKERQRQQIEALRNELADQKTKYQNMKQYNDSAVQQAKRNYFENQALRQSIAEKHQVEDSLRRQLAQITIKVQESTVAQKPVQTQVPVSTQNQEFINAEITILEGKVELQQAKAAELNIQILSLRQEIKRRADTELALKAELNAKAYPAKTASEQQHLSKLNAELTVTNDHLRDRIQLSNKQLNEAKDQLEQLKTAIATKAARASLPETGHVIRESHKYDMVESMLGFGLSPDAKKNVHIKASIIEEAPLPPQRKEEGSKGKVQQALAHSKVDAVETVLGFAIPPSRHAEIHTEGVVESSKPSNEAMEALRLAEQLESVRLAGELLREELEVVKKASSFQRELFQIEKQQSESAYRESEAGHIQEKQTLAAKLKEYQELYAQLGAKLSDIQSQPITVSPKKEEKPENTVSTDILKPSMLKTKSSKAEDVPVWVKVRTEEQKPIEAEPNEAEAQSPPAGPRVSRVSEMKKLFQGFNKGSSKKE